MPRIVRRSVSESIEELTAYEETFRGQPQEPRIRLLRTIRSRPDLTFEQAVVTAGVHPRSAYRWWKSYKREGLAGVVTRGVGRPPEDTTSSKTGGKLSLAVGGGGARDVMSFINGMPMQLALLEGINGLRAHMNTLLPDVDRISIQVNTHCDLERPWDYRPSLSISQRADQSDRLDEGMEVRTLVRDEMPSEELLEQMKRGGFPFQLYHEPVCIDIWLEETADLGALILWREIEKAPISPESLAFVDQIRPFLVYVFANMVTRHHYANPGDRVFYSVLSEMSVSAKLTAQERRVISYRLMGYSYKRIADELQRTVGAVKKQLASVHRKTGTQGHGELFAKYFSPRLVPTK